MDTIFALSTPAGKSAIAVVRVSGPDAVRTLAALKVKAPPARLATLAPLHSHATGEVIDTALVLYFPAPASFTGEDVVEYHIHGGRAGVKALLTALAALPSLRPAEPGEFTRRAYLSGKMDLTAAEGLADLIDAETEGQRKQALRFMQGEAETFYQRLRADVLHALALMEAVIDFPDEDIPAHILKEADALACAIAERIEGQLKGGFVAERVRDGVQVVILGPPNAGKSSLMNLLAKRDVAIVSHTPGTTRDVIEVHLDIAGFAVMVADTAGLRETGDDIEREGVRRSIERAKKADIRIVVLDATEVCGQDSAFSLSKLFETGGLRKPAPASRMQGTTERRTGVYTSVHEDSSTGVTQQAAAGVEFTESSTILLINKTDLTLPSPLPVIEGITPIAFSAKTGTGMQALLEALGERVGQLCTAESSYITRTRHRHHLSQALAHLQNYLLKRDAGPELRGEELRRAGVEIGRITGAIAADEVLGEIFSRFCIGK